MTAEWCPDVVKAHARAVKSLGDVSGSRHEAIRDAVRNLVAYGGEGHRGARAAVEDLSRKFADAVGPERIRGGEWYRLLQGAVELAVTANPTPRQSCSDDQLTPFTGPPGFDLAASLADALQRAVPAAPPVAGQRDDAGAYGLPDIGELSDAVIVQRIHDDLLADRYCWAVGFGWMRWNGKVWLDAAEETVREAIRVWAVDVMLPLLKDPFIGNSKEHRNRLQGLLDTYRCKALAELSRGICQVDPDVFDAEPDMFNAQNGIVDLRTGSLLPHDPNRHMTRIAAVDYRADAEHEDWPAALAAVPPEVAEWLQARFGQAITGHMTPDDVLLLLHGGGSNGKSTVLAAINSALGGYATYVSDRVLLAKADAHPTELTEFRGARFALTEELPDNGHLNAKRLKDIIGTPTMTARKIRQDSITWDSTHTMFVSTNYLPKVTETDDGTWRRMLLVKFPFKFVPRDQYTGADHEHIGDPGLRDRLKDGTAQHEAVLRWLVAGAVRWYADEKVMPATPDVVKDATEAWRAASDIIVRFWAEKLVASRENFISATDMQEAFNDWAHDQGHSKWSASVLAARFGEHSRTLAAGVHYQRRRVAVGEVQSFRPRALSLGGGPFPSTALRPQPEPGTQIRAWWGVRFAELHE